MKKYMLYITALLSSLIIPLMVAASLIIILCSSADFHVSIIKNLNLVKTFIEARNFQLEKDIKREIEKKTGITLYKAEYDRIKKDYDEKLLAYDSLNKTDEYKKIETQIDELDDMDWEKAPENFKNENDFDIFKKQKMQDLKLSLKVIKDYRDANNNAIDEAEDAMDKSKDIFDDADDEMKDKENYARKIIDERRGDFMNEMYSDIAKIEPALTASLNTLFIDREIKNIIKSYIDFFTSYFRQKQAGNVYETRLDIESGIIANTKKVSLPPFTVSFRVTVNENGIEKEKNLVREVFVEQIRDTPGLKSPWVMTKIFALSDSWIAETAGNSVLKDTGLTYSDGVIKSGPIVLAGRKAEIAEKAMILMTAGKYLPFAAAGVLVLMLIIMFLLSPDRKTGFRFTGFVLKYPSVIVVIAGISVILISLIPGLMLPEIVNDPYKYAFFDRIAMTVALHFFVPLTALFFILSLAGSILIKLGRKK